MTASGPASNLDNTAVGRLDPSQPRHDWTLEEVEALFELPFTELVFRAAEIYRRWFDPAELQLSQLLSVKTG
ncbi:MAG: biotin synthase, partial [Proteobacteria bacterium]|nr:biotin synthase [Pseudomonadota bacterium]